MPGPQVQAAASRQKAPVGTAGGWISRVRDGEVIDDEKYADLIADCLDDIRRPSMPQAGAQPEEGLSDLALMLEDRELLPDMMSAMKARSLGEGDRPSAMQSANEYTFLALETFSVYTDLGDMADICATAASDLGDLCAHMKELPEVQAKGPTQVEFLDNYASFFTMMEGRMRARMAEESPERLEYLSDYWAEKSGKRFTQLAYGAANMNVQLLGSGWLSTKIATKGRDMQLDTFISIYFSPKQP